MTRQRSNWRPIPGTPAHRAYRRLVRDGVAVLCVRLAGYAENNPDGVGLVADALDELAASFSELLDVTTLDVRGFCNASDDACQILTRVFDGLPCCWITNYWDQQRGLARWDLPAAERMAPTGEAALARVIGWRRAGGFSIDHGDGSARSWQWTDRGLAITDLRRGAPVMTDLWHKNQLFERTLHDRGRHILWPGVDATGAPNEAMRRGTRLIVEGGQVIDDA